MNYIAAILFLACAVSVAESQYGYGSPGYSRRMYSFGYGGSYRPSYYKSKRIYSGYGHGGSSYGHGGSSYGHGGSSYGHGGSSYGHGGSSFGHGGSSFGHGGSSYGHGGGHGQVHKSVSYTQPQPVHVQKSVSYTAPQPSYGHGVSTHGHGVSTHGHGVSTHGHGQVHGQVQKTVAYTQPEHVEKRISYQAPSYGHGGSSYDHGGSSFGHGGSSYGHGGSSYGHGGSYHYKRPTYVTKSFRYSRPRTYYRTYYKNFGYSQPSYGSSGYGH